MKNNKKYTSAEEWAAFKYAWRNSTVLSFMVLTIIFIAIAYVFHSYGFMAVCVALAIVTQIKFDKAKKHYLESNELE